MIGAISRRHDDFTDARGYASLMRLGAIDVGSNSVHMIIADVGREGHIQVVDRVKEMVRLGRRTFMTGRLPDESMDLAVRALNHFVRIARVRKVDRMRAVATSAVREARNRTAFVRRVRRETGLALEVISGNEEARLIFLAARHALGLDGGPHLLVDVGGGSVELVLVQDGRPLWMKSSPLGVARLTERYLSDDPPSGAQLRRLEKHLDSEIGDLLVRARKGHPGDRNLGNDQYARGDGAGGARRRARPPARGDGNRRRDLPPRQGFGDGQRGAAR
jgi:exopolyphosphatase/guanosine-5'-triphosphate,3'-diphosphate pyrophosphatase